MNKDSSDKFRQRLGIVFYVGAFTAVVALVFLHFINLPKAPYYNDEILTVFASRGVIERGFPSLPTGTFYPNSLPNNYLVALSMWILGDNAVGHRMVSFVFSILCLIVTYLLGKKFFSRHTAIAAVLLLALSQFETNYAISARMYMQLQFLSLFFVYSFYRGFWEGNKKFMWLSFVSLIFGIYTNLLMLLFIPPVLLYLTIQRKKWWHDRCLIVGASITILSLIILVAFPNFLSVRDDWANAGIKNVVGFSFDHSMWYIKFLISEFPLGSLFVCFALVYLIYKRGTRQRVVYLALNFLVPLLFVSLTAAQFRDRYALIVFPFFIILAAYGAWQWILFLLQTAYSKKLKLLRWGSLILVSIFALSPGYVLKTGLQTTTRDYGPSFEYLKKNLNQADVIISDNIPLLMMYVGRCDYVVAQSFRDNQWVGFSVDRDVRFGTKILDSLPDIQVVFGKNKKIWYVDTFYQSGDDIMLASREIVDYLQRVLILKFIDPQNYTAVFLYEKQNE